MAWVDLAAVRARYEGVISPEQETWVNACIDEAERLLRDLVPDVDERITANVTAPETVRDVVRASVLRVLRNPGGFTTEASGEYSYSRNGITGAEAAFTALDLARVTGASRRRSRTIGVRPPGPWQGS